VAKAGTAEIKIKRAANVIINFFFNKNTSLFTKLF
jgi:hypothetical protein